jgi:hypothetical protein
MHFCFLNAQDIAPLPSEKIHLDVDLLSLVLIIQLVSLYPSITTGKLK